MRVMKNAVVIVMLGWAAFTSQAQEANTIPADINNIEHEQFRMPEEETSDPWVFEENYTKEPGFQRQIGITQVATGSVLLPAGLAMIGAGIYKFNSTPSSESPEVEVPTKVTKRAGAILTVTGSLSSVAGAILLMKGIDTLKKVKNRKGEVVGEITLPTSGIVGVSMKF